MTQIKRFKEWLDEPGLKILVGKELVEYIKWKKVKGWEKIWEEPSG